MRIISGKHKGRQLQAPTKLPVRPTTDRAKEALFNWLQHRYDLGEVRALDLFTGTGNISYELGSRGCKQITAVDQHPGCCRYVKATAELLQLPIEVVQADVFSYFKRAVAADLVFADPPYDHPELKTLPDLILHQQLVLPDGVLILEHPAHIQFEQHQQLLEIRTYGQSVFSIFEPIPRP
ncbi:MAG: RsmD family RNA methyltransferase [Sphingobacteriaceae bacterium]|nr:RsmD family RNA methyltransferase [Sphingobacteriaceae bacterium]